MIILNSSWKPLLALKYFLQRPWCTLVPHHVKPKKIPAVLHVVCTRNMVSSRIDVSCTYFPRTKFDKITSENRIPSVPFRKTRMPLHRIFYGNPFKTAQVKSRATRSGVNFYLASFFFCCFPTAGTRGVDLFPTVFFSSLRNYTVVVPGGGGGWYLGKGGVTWAPYVPSPRNTRFFSSRPERKFSLKKRSEMKERRTGRPEAP